MYTGLWVRVQKPPVPIPGTLVHNDQPAQELGFSSGLVGGPTLAAVTIPALEASFSHHWYESGVYSVRFARPAYDGEEVRVVWEDSEPGQGEQRRIDFRVEKRDGERVTFGWAALGEPGQKLTPPWESTPAPAAEPAEDLMPYLHVGDTQPPFECRPSEDPRSWVVSRLDMIDDRNLWYRVASPWGAPILTPVRISELTRQYAGPLIQLTRLKMRTIMDAGFDVVVYSPVFIDGTYRVQSWLCDKGQSERSVFWTIGSSIDDSDGRRVAMVRLKSRRLISDLPAEND